MLSNDTLVSAIPVLVKKIFTKNRSDVHYFWQTLEVLISPNGISSYVFRDNN